MSEVKDNEIRKAGNMEKSLDCIPVTQGSHWRALRKVMYTLRETLRAVLEWLKDTPQAHSPISILNFHPMPSPSNQKEFKIMFDYFADSLLLW